MAEDTAGGLMTTDYVYILSDVTVSQAISMMYGNLVTKPRQFIIIYVVDDKKHLQGVCLLRELISAPQEQEDSGNHA
jgi:magnesium transporter